MLPREIPTTDAQEYWALSDANRDRVTRGLAAIKAVREARPVVGILAALASVSSAQGGCRGFTPGRLKTAFYAYQNTADWRVFVDRTREKRSGATCTALVASQPAALPPDFLVELQRRADANQRKIAPAIRSIQRDWRNGKSLPGYGTFFDWWALTQPGVPAPTAPDRFPDGWSGRNLARYLDKSQYRRVAQTQGRANASAARPLVYTTRAGLWVGSHIQFDDVWHDIFVNTFQQKQAGRPLELFSHDLFSAKKIAWIMRVRTQRADGTMEGLTAQMMRMILAATLSVGYSTRGTVLVVERGTAAISEKQEEILYTESGGLVTVSRNGMQGAAAHAGQYAGRPKGNPRFKASLESHNNLAHNELANLPGQTGRDILHRPEQLHGMLKHNEALMEAYAAWEQSHPELAAALEFPLLEYTAYARIVADIYGAIEDYTDHQLEGWRECGHTTQEVMMDGHWLSQDALVKLPPAQLQNVITMLTAGLLVARPRQLSRREVWLRGCRALRPISGGAVCSILGEDFATERSVRSHMFAFADAELGPGMHRYAAIATAPDGSRLELRDGQKYQTAVNPASPDALHVRDAKGRYIGACAALHTPCRGDVQAVQRAMGAAAKLEGELLADLRQRQMPAAEARAAASRRNADLLRQSGARGPAASARPALPTRESAAEEDAAIALLLNRHDPALPGDDF